MLRTRSTVLASALLLTFSGFAFADIPGLTSFSGGTPATSGADQLYGWVFSVNSPMTVSALGVYDFNGVGLQVSHDVGIFEDSSESLLGSTTVAAGPCTLIDSFCYQSVSPFSLAAGDTYTIVMTMPQGNTDDGLIQNSVVNTASQISYVTSAFDNGSTLAYPTIDGVFAPGIFGPNFLFSSATPEPAFYGVLGVGLAALVIAHRRRRMA